MQQLRQGFWVAALNFLEINILSGPSYDGIFFFQHDQGFFSVSIK